MIGVPRVIVFSLYLGATVTLLQACGTMPLPQEADGAVIPLPIPQPTANHSPGADVNAGAATATLATPKPDTVDVMGTVGKTHSPPSSLLGATVELNGQQPPAADSPPPQQAVTSGNDNSVLETASAPSPGQLPSHQSTLVPVAAEDSSPESSPGKTQSKTQKPAVTVEPSRVASEDEIKYALANRYFNAGRYQNTIDVLETNGSDKNTTAKSRELLVMAYIEYATKLTAKSEMSEAQVLLDKAASIQPGNKRISEQLAKIKSTLESNRVYQTAVEKYNSGQRQEAFTLFHRVLQLNPQHAKAAEYYAELKSDAVDQHHKKALLFYRKQQLKEAIKEWDELLLLDPGNDMAKIYRSRAVELKSKIEKL